MTPHNDRYFLLSGIFSFSFFFFIVLVITFSYSLSSTTPLMYAMNKSNVISVSLSSEPMREVSEASAPEQSREEQKEEPAVETPKSETSEPKPQEVSDLFADVKIPVESKKKSEKLRDTKELDALAQKVANSKRQSDVFEKVKSLDLAKSGVKVTAASSGPNVDVYNAKIQGIVYANFHPSAGTEGFSARIRIRLSADGTLIMYKVLSYSANSLFNSEVDWLKERLKQVALPKNPNGEEAVFDILLTAKG